MSEGYSVDLRSGLARRVGRAVSGSRALIGVLVLLTGAAACDPCTGVGSCTGPRVRYQGQLVRGIGLGLEPVPAETVTVKFVPAGGVELEQDELVARSDMAGKFMLEGRARAEGESWGDLWIYPPAPAAPVNVGEVRMTTSRAPGELHALGTWKIPYPYLGYQFRLFYRATGKPATGLQVEVRRTGGIGLASDTFKLESDPRGFVIFRADDVDRYGELSLDMSMQLLPPREPVVVRGLKLKTFIEERYDSIIPIGIGDRISYVAILKRASDGAPVADEVVEFRRTGGIAVVPERLIGRTNAEGGLLINPVPITSGVVTGDLIVRPASGGEYVIPDLKLKTLDDDVQDQFLGFLDVPGL
jgi:hypothetical protein